MVCRPLTSLEGLMMKHGVFSTPQPPGHRSEKTSAVWLLSPPLQLQRLLAVSLQNYVRRELKLELPAAPRAFDLVPYAWGKV
jgi:hypothetical protein